jgi:hypothetical protein
MKQRCNNERAKDYSYYGNRGITICSRWNVFANFLADMGEAPPGLTIDRIDNNGDYEPGNCQWATRKQQARNTRANKITTERANKIKSMRGTKTQREIGEEFGVNKTMISMIHLGKAWG